MFEHAYMLTTHRLIKIGNSVGIVIPKLYLEELHLRLGDLIILEHDEIKQVIVFKPRKNFFIVDPNIEFKYWIKGISARAKENRRIKEKYGDEFQE